jgi:hypothetical protein
VFFLDLFCLFVLYQTTFYGEVIFSLFYAHSYGAYIALRHRRSLFALLFIKTQPQEKAHVSAPLAAAMHNCVVDTTYPSLTCGLKA